MKYNYLKIKNIMEDFEKSSKLPDGWKDWNTLTIDQMVEYLENKYKFSSTGDAKCIFTLIDFYKNL